MKISKKLFFRIHSWIGVKLSILFFIVCFSGSLATLSSEYDWLFTPEIRAKDTGQRPTYNTMVANIKKAYPNGRMASIVITPEPYLCNKVFVYLDDQRYHVFVNPYTGEVQGHTTLSFYRFFRNLHYFLFIPYQYGHFIVLSFGFMLLISSITALYFYKKWWRKLFELKIGKGKLVFYRSLHRLVGVWSVPFAMLFSITGIWYFLERTSTIETSSITSPKIEIVGKAKKIDYDSLDYDKAISVAENAIPNLKVKSFIPPINTKSTWYLIGKSDEPLVRNRANRVFLHPEDYSVLKIQDASKIPTITWLNDIADPLHFGNWGGLITKIIWFIGGMALSGLVLTGIWIFVKRNANGKIKKKKYGIWKYINWIIVGVMNFYMFVILKTRYLASTKMLTVLAVSILILLFLTWYLFVYKIKISSKN